MQGSLPASQPNMYFPGYFGLQQVANQQAKAPYQQQAYWPPGIPGQQANFYPYPSYFAGQ
jgi:hypothetical protein